MADLDSPGYDAPTVDVRHEDGAVVIRLSGDLDLAGVKQVRPAIDAALSSHPGRVILDASALEYVDSSGIALMVLVTRMAQEVQVRHPAPVVRQLIELTGLSEILQITDESQP